MRKTWGTVLLFAAALAVLLAAAALIESLRPAAEPEVSEPAEPAVVANVMDEAGAAVIRLDEGGISATGLGTVVSGNTVTIGYPGTYRVSGILEDGQLVVDCGDYHGAVYIILEGASVAYGSGPALYIKQADRTVLYLAEGTENTLRDGTGYVIVEGQDEKSGGGIYSADDLVIEGGGSLTVVGANADGIRSKDGLTVSGGALTVYSVDDGLQGSDHVTVEGGVIVLNAGGDGINVTEGGASVSGGELAITSDGDGISAATEVSVSGGTLSIVTHGGADGYADAALADVSAKGLKAPAVSITGGSVRLDTADDGIHGEETVSVSGGTLTVSSGDDALHAALSVDISGGEVDITESYEALEAELVAVRDGRVTAAASHNAVDAGEDGFVMTGGLAALSAPRCIGSEGGLAVEDGCLFLNADGTDSPLKFVTGSVTGGTVVLCANGTQADILEDGELAGSLLYMFPAALPAGTAVAITDASGGTALSFETAASCTGILAASGAMGLGQSYTLTAGDYTGTGALAAGCTVVTVENEALPAAEEAPEAASAFSAGPGGNMASPGMPG